MQERVAALEEEVRKLRSAQNARLSNNLALALPFLLTCIVLILTILSMQRTERNLTDRVSKLEDAVNSIPAPLPSRE